MPTPASNFRFFLAATVLLGGAVLALAQNQPSSAPASSDTPGNSDSSLPSAARSSKLQKTARAKKVVTDEDMEATAGPLPRLKMDSAENADEIVEAIVAYKATHTPQQTEEAVRIWYERYDTMLAAAIQQNLDVKVLREENLSNGYELCQQSQDYEQCTNRRMAELRGARSDQVEIAKNTALVVRIQHVFMKIRNGLTRNNLRYDWFKIRTTNNIDTF